jgi:hypothetical protein
MTSTRSEHMISATTGRGTYRVCLATNYSCVLLYCTCIERIRLKRHRRPFQIPQYIQLVANRHGLRALLLPENVVACVCVWTPARSLCVLQLAESCQPRVALMQRRKARPISTDIIGCWAVGCSVRQSERKSLFWSSNYRKS